MFYGESLTSILLVATTLKYWISHESAWFIALLVPLYALAPWLDKCLRVHGQYKMIFTLVVCYCVALIPQNIDSHSFLANVQFAIIRVPVFILGMWLGPSIKKQNKLNLGWVLLSLFIGLVIVAIIRKPLPSYFFFTLPLLYVLASFCERLKMLKFRAVLLFWGGITLESYMFNTTLPKYVHSLLEALAISDNGNYLLYAIVVVVGTFLAIVVNRVVKKILA